MQLPTKALVWLMIVGGALVTETAAQPIEVRAADFTAAKYLTAEQQEEVRKQGILKGIGEAEYAFEVAQTGWHELWVEACGWPSDLLLDGVLLFHGPLTSDAWEKDGNLAKLLNVHLAAGKHSLRVVRSWHPGLPYLRRFVLKPAEDIPGMVRLALRKDYLCFRLRERFPAVLRAGRRDASYELTISIVDTANGETVHTLRHAIPAGDGLSEQPLVLPTNREGVFDVQVTDAQGRQVDRVLQYLVVDTKTPPPAPEKLERVLVQEIDCAKREPDYINGETRVVDSPVGAYRESGDRGQAEQGLLADWFAYTLDLPSVQEPYALEIDYPDDDERTFTYSLIERDLPGGRALTHGVASGGIYPLSGELHTAEMVFYPRQRDPRVHLRTWWNGQRAAAARIRVYRVTSGFPALRPAGNEGDRRFGRYQEEPLRFVQWGARPEGGTWRNLWDAAERIGQFSRHVGVNFWHPTIAIYGSTLWPSKYLPSLDPDADAWATVGPASLKEPLAKDNIRLLLLVCEKYGTDFVGELFMPASRSVAREYFEERFGGDGEIEWKDPNAKPWLIVHRNGKGPGTPLYNPLYPGIQDWVADIVAELAARYKDSPAFKGVALRFMGWQFHGWQGFPSIDWGYGDYTVELFEKETGIDVPVDQAAADRFRKRYEWLLANAYDQWVEWRCRRVLDYHARLAKILTDARPDLKLYLDLHGPTFGAEAPLHEWEEKGWTGLLRETGIDPALCKGDPAIVIRERRHYPPGRRGIDTKDPEIRAERIREFYDSAPFEATARPADSGTVCAAHFDANSFESNMVKVADLGLGEHLGSGPRDTQIHGAGLVFPAGRHFLERYANAMADANLTSITDGSHGYICWPSKWLREFNAEYGALPNLGMTKLAGSGDPVALWHGKQDGKLYFYLVNRTYHPVEADVELDRGARVQRLSTGQTAALDGNGRLHLSMRAYELAAFVNKAGGAPTSLRTAIPEADRQQLEAQLAFVERLLSLAGVEQTLLPFSLVDLQRAKRKLTDAREALADGRCWATWRLLLHPHLMKVYEALSAYPPNLFHRKAPPTPQGALQPRALLDRLDASPRAGAKVVAASDVDPALTGEQLIVWKGAPVTLNLEAPLANRYRLSLAYASKAPYSRPAVSLPDGPPVVDDALPVEQNAHWGRMTALRPLTLARGAHRLSLGATDSTVGLFHLALQPLPRRIVANEWMVIGPFPSEKRWGQVGTGIDEVYPPEQRRAFDATYEGDAGQQVAWRQPESASGYVDLHQLTGACADRVGYAVTTIHSPDARPVELRFGVDYWARLWLNGKQVFEITEAHGAPCADQFTIPAQLRQGANELLLKIHAGSRGNGFWLSISDPGDLRIAPKWVGRW